MASTGYSDSKRLADVMALIQVLAQAADDTIRSETGLTKELQGKPTSGANSWIELAEAHREFFRVHGDEQNKRAALISRFVLAKDERGKRRPLTADETAKLLELAVSLHDREVLRRQRFDYLIPALVGGLFSLLGVIVGLWLSCKSPTR